MFLLFLFLINLFALSKAETKIWCSSKSDIDSHYFLPGVKNKLTAYSKY